MFGNLEKSYKTTFIQCNLFRHGPFGHVLLNKNKMYKK